jgi:hypothetical protein
MRLVRCGAGLEFRTTDAIAEALLQYALTSGNYGRRELVRIPVRRDDGETDEVVMLIAAETQLSSEHVAGPEDDLAPLLAIDLLEREAQLRGTAVDPWMWDEGDALPRS